MRLPTTSRGEMICVNVKKTSSHDEGFTTQRDMGPTRNYSQARKAKKLYETLSIIKVNRQNFHQSERFSKISINQSDATVQRSSRRTFDREGRWLQPCSLHCMMFFFRQETLPHLPEYSALLRNPN